MPAYSQYRAKPTSSQATNPVRVLCPSGSSWIRGTTSKPRIASIRRSLQLAFQSSRGDASSAVCNEGSGSTIPRSSADVGREPSGAPDPAPFYVRSSASGTAGTPPHQESGKRGFHATSQRNPSGSAKYPEEPPHSAGAAGLDDPTA